MTRKSYGLGIAAVLASASIARAQGYPSAKVENHTDNEATAHITYAACKGDNIARIAPITMVSDHAGNAKTVIATGVPSARRGACLITKVEAGFTKGDTKARVTPYTSTGTSYSEFMIIQKEDGYRVYSKQEYARETANPNGMSPGFDIVNKTDWPISIALSQVGCLYYGTIKPGERFNRSTGSVWFTIQANIAADGKEPRKDWDCVKPVAIVVGAVLLTAATAGKAAWVALPAMKAGTAAAALAPIAASKAVWVSGMAAGKVLGGTGAGSAVWGAKQIGDALAPNGAGELKGQYAGYDWPFRCARPSYEVTGGWGPPGIRVDGKDTTYGIAEGTPLKITKVNDCGSKMNR